MHEQRSGAEAREGQKRRLHGPRYDGAAATKQRPHSGHYFDGNTSATGTKREYGASQIAPTVPRVVDPSVVVISQGAAAAEDHAGQGTLRS